MFPVTGWYIKCETRETKLLVCLIYTCVLYALICPMCLHDINSLPNYIYWLYWELRKFFNNFRYRFELFHFNKVILCNNMLPLSHSRLNQIPLNHKIFIVEIIFPFHCSLRFMRAYFFLSVAPLRSDKHT